MFTHKKAKGWKRHRGTPGLMQKPIWLEGGVVVCGFCAQQLAYKGKTQLAYKGKTMVSVLKHFLARPHMAHADNAADGRQRNMMRIQETLAAAEDHSGMAARIRSGALALQLQAGNSFVAAGLSTVAERSSRLVCGSIPFRRKTKLVCERRQILICARGFGRTSST
jgi:hypothetical protein